MMNGRRRRLATEGAEDGEGAMHAFFCEWANEREGRRMQNHEWDELHE